MANSRTDDVWFVRGITGWAFNSNGQILKTTGGNNWIQEIQVPAYLRAVTFADANRGWGGTLFEGTRLLGDD